MATIHINHPVDVHKTKTKLQINQTDADLGKNIQLQGAEFDQLVKTSINNNNSHDPDSQHSAQQRALSRHALRRQRIMQNSTTSNEDDTLAVNFQSNLKTELNSNEDLLEKKQKNLQSHHRRNEHLLKDEKHYEKADKNNLAAEALKIMDFENAQILSSEEAKETNTPTDITSAWEEVISAVNTSMQNGRTSVLMTLQSAVFFGSQIQITQYIVKRLSDIRWASFIPKNPCWPERY